MHVKKVHYKERHKMFYGAQQEFKNEANIVILYKNKGDGGDCNNYHGISLLSVVEKLLAHLVLKRLQVLADSLSRITVWILS